MRVPSRMREICNRLSHGGPLRRDGANFRRSKRPLAPISAFKRVIGGLVMPLDLADRKQLRAAPADEADAQDQKPKGLKGATGKISRKLRPWLIAGVVAILAIAAWLTFGSNSNKPQ